MEILNLLYELLCANLLLETRKHLKSLYERICIEKKGDTRRAIIIPALGLVVKIPLNEDGKAINRSEYQYYKNCPNPFIVATYACLGRNNIIIQRLPDYALSFFPIHREATDEEYDTYQIAVVDHLNQMKMLTDGDCMLDAHTMINGANFGVKKKHLVIFDYGETLTQEIVSLYGKRVWENYSLKAEHFNGSENFPVDLFPQKT